MSMQSVPLQNLAQRNNATTNIPATTAPPHASIPVPPDAPTPVQPTPEQGLNQHNTGAHASISSLSSVASTSQDSVTSLPSHRPIILTSSIPAQNVSEQSNHAGIPTTATAHNVPTTTTPTTTVPGVRLGQSRKYRHVKYWFKAGVAFLVYILTLYITTSSLARHTVLGRVSAPLGTWFLVMLSKAGDIAFALAVADAIDTLTWRSLKERAETSRVGKAGGLRLESYLALMSTTGVEGLFRIVMRGRKVGWLKHSPGGCAFIRLVFVLLLIPGPGIILTANITQQNVFFPVRSMNVSAGLADFDSRLAATYHTVLGPEIAHYVQTMLSDRTITWPVDPINEGCKKDQSCVSYLLAGQYQVVSPWPFTVEDDDVDAFRVVNAPFYQADMWYSPTSLAFNRSNDCKLYGGFNATSEYSMLLCLAQQSSEGLLAAGWASCQSGYAPNGTCLAAGSDTAPGWNTYLQFYRRKATITFSRSDFIMQEVANLSSPTAVQIPPSTLLDALNSVLYQPNQTSSDPRFDRKSMQYVLTQNIAIKLWQSLNQNLAGLNLGMNWLRNLLTMPVYVFQPTMASFANNLVPLGVDNGTLPAPNLPTENIVEGSYCIVNNRSVPSWGTVIAYAIVAGLVLVFVVVAKLVAALWPPVETSDFTMLDFNVLTEVLDEGHPPEEVVLKERFANRSYEEHSVLEELKGLYIGLQRI